MARWTLPIQPNSLVAILSTIAKSSVLIPLAECIGQLKWTYFERPAATRLDHMQAFDEASRGPWGAMIFLWKIRGTAALASGGAFITILMLGFEPFTQQVIEQRIQHTVLSNFTGYVIAATTYNATALVPATNEMRIPNDVHFALTSGILGSVVDQKFNMPNNTGCQTMECRFRDYTSLAVCATCENQDVDLHKDSESCWWGVEDPTKAASYLQNNFHFFQNHSEFRSFALNASRELRWRRNCTIDYPGYPSFKLTFERFYSEQNRVQFTLTHGAGNLLGPSYFVMGESMLSWYHGSNFTLLSGNFASESTSHGVLSSCDATGRGDGKDVPFAAFAHSSCFRTMSNPRDMESINHFGEISGILTRCRSSLCVQRYENVTLTPVGHNVKKITDIPLKAKHGGNMTQDLRLNTQYWATADKADYEIQFDDDNLKALFAQSAEALRSSSVYNRLKRFQSTENGTWVEFHKRIATVLTQVVQNPTNPSAVRIPGEAYGPEVFIRVNWPWFIMPSFAVLASTVFLLLTMYQSSQKPYLFKNSIMAVLYHGLDQSQDISAMGMYLKRKETYHDIIDCSRNVMVTLKKNEEGCLKLKRE
ncbi:hypothetical protein B0J11DRAFT_585100 [Dendryphion nanum]|uniref:Uncharacterized protein n=1 Tax=Dendryphion nanum TaxID=256645 RepID=A0A9P9D7M5_9PLEO|nr:hypothetical protein B0J11DRAFT_585100 [Dendryphion nanum]